MIKHIGLLIIIAIAAFLAMAIVAVGCGDTVVNDPGNGGNQPVIPPGADGAIVATPRANSSDYFIKFNWNPTPSPSRSEQPLIAATPAIVVNGRPTGTIPVNVGIQDSGGRATHPDTMALRAWIEGEWIPSGQTTAYKSDTMIVVRTAGTSTIIFSGIPNGPGLKIVFDEYSDTAATVRIGKRTTIRLQEVPAGNSAWSATINLGGSWANFPDSLAEAITLPFDGGWSEWQIVADTGTTASPDYDLNTSGVQGLEEAVVRFTNDTRQRVTVQVDAVQFVTGAAAELTFYDPDAVVRPAGATFISYTGGTSTQPGDNPLDIALGLNKQSDEIDPGVYWAGLELTTGNLTTFRMQVGRGTIVVGGGI